MSTAKFDCVSLQSLSIFYLTTVSYSHICQGRNVVKIPKYKTVKKNNASVLVLSRYKLSTICELQGSCVILHKAIRRASVMELFIIKQKPKLNMHEGE